MSNSYFGGSGAISPQQSQIGLQQHFELQPGADLTDSINAEIDRATRSNSEYFNLLIRQYRELDTKAQNRPQQLVQLLGQASDVKKEATEWIQDQIEVGQFSSHLDDKKYLESVKGGENWEDIGAVNPRPVSPHAIYDELANKDSSVSKINELEPKIDEVEAEAHKVAAEILETRPTEATKALALTEGPDGRSLARHEQAISIGQLKGIYPAMREKLEAGLPVRIPESCMPLNDQGEQHVTTYELASGCARDYIDRTIDAWIYHKHKNVIGGNLGIYKRDFLKWMIEKRDERYSKYKLDEAQAVSDVLRKRRAKELTLKIQNSKSGYLVNYINKYAPYNQGRKDLTRVEAFNHMAYAYEYGDLSRDKIEQELGTEFWANDGSRTTPEKLWKKDTAKLLKRMREADNTEIDERKEEADHKEKLWVSNVLEKVYESKDLPSYKRKQEIIQEFMAEFNKSIEQVPDELKRLATLGSVPDEILHQELLYRYNRGERLTARDIAGFENAEKKAEWTDRIKGSGIDTATRDSAIAGFVVQKTRENDGRLNKTTKYRAYTYNATLAFNKAYLAAKQNDATDSEAMAAGIAAVEKGLALGKPGDTSWANWGANLTPQDVNEILTKAKVKDAIAKDRNLIFSDKPWEGEEPHIKQALEYLNKKRINLPTYYKSFPSIKISPLKLMMTRLNSLGLIDDKDAVIPEDELSEATKALLIKPSPAKTLRANIKAKEDGKTLINPEEYEFDTDLVNEEEELNKEADRLYGDFELSAVQELRAKAQTAQQYALIDSSYRTLVNVPQELNDEFTAQVGDLPPYLQLNNLAPEVAKAFIGDILMT